MFPDIHKKEVSGQEDAKYEKDYEVEIDTEDFRQQAKILHRQEALRKLKRTKRPKGHFMCPDEICHYTNEWEEKIAVHVASRHHNSEYAARANEAIKTFLAKKQEKDQEKARIRKLEKAALKEAEAIRAERAINDVRARHEKKREEMKTENMIREIEEAERRKEKELLMAMGMDMSEHQYLHQDKIQRAESFREERSEDDQDDENGSGDGREDQSDQGKRSPDRASKSSRRSRKPRKTGRGKHGGRGSDPPSRDGE